MKTYLMLKMKFLQTVVEQRNKEGLKEDLKESSKICDGSRGSVSLRSAISISADYLSEWHSKHDVL
jgi:hypothetical protein